MHAHTGPDGGERAVTVRVDTATGRVWQVPFTARPLRWMQIRDAAQAGK